MKIEIHVPSLETLRNRGWKKYYRISINDQTVFNIEETDSAESLREVIKECQQIPDLLRKTFVAGKNGGNLTFITYED